jgi:FtsP/CotA-like multicopper oxidase with cupredoxin domain
MDARRFLMPTVSLLVLLTAAIPAAAQVQAPKAPRRSRLAAQAALAPAPAPAQVPLNATKIPQFVDPLPLLGPTGIPFSLGTAMGGSQVASLRICEFQTQVLPTGTFAPGVAPLTWVWGYQEGTGPCNPLPGHSYLGPVMLTKRGVPTQMTFVNQLPDVTSAMVQAFPKSTDQTVTWGDPLSLNTAPPPVTFNSPPGTANPELNACHDWAMANPGLVPPIPCQNNYAYLAPQPTTLTYAAPIPTAVHIHGGEVPAMLDGGPDSWWTPNGIYGHGFYTRHVKSLPALLSALPALPATVAALPAMAPVLAALPALPNPLYPPDGVTVYFDQATVAYYVNVADVWTAATVPYPLGTIVYSQTNAGYFQNVANVWTAAAAAYPIGAVVQVPDAVKVFQVYENFGNAWVASVITPYPDGTLVFNEADGKNYQAVAGAWTLKAQIDRASYVYPNGQEPAPVWFHDHLLGATRLNVYAGIAGGYYITDDQLTNPGTLAPGLLPLGLDRNGNNTLDLAPGAEEVLVPLIIQDRMFDTTGQLYFPALGINPDHPYWIPEFIGDTIAVNGRVWPYLAVKPQRYRFLVLNGSNARSYELFLFNKAAGTKGPPIWVIGNDQGYLDTPQQLNPNLKGGSLVIMPGERYEIVVDFSGSAGATLEMRNTAKAPYAGGSPPSGSTTGRILQFRVAAAVPGAVDTSWNPAAVGAVVRTTPMQRLTNAATGTPAVTPLKTRRLTLNEVTAKGGPLEILVNNTLYDGKSNRAAFGRNDFTPITTMWNTSFYSELPAEGETELWEIVNLTADAHPIHPHLIGFQILNRQALDLKGYSSAYAASFPGGLYLPGFGPPLDYNCGGPVPGRGATACILGGNPDPALFLLGAAIPPAPQEIGWKDTVMVPSGMVTRFLVRFAKTTAPVAAPADTLAYDFNPDGGHGYVWHCHIIDHEDNEMMRPYTVQPNPAATRSYVMGLEY